MVSGFLSDLCYWVMGDDYIYIVIVIAWGVAVNDELYKQGKVWFKQLRISLEGSKGKFGT
jgi:hypothetical protein